MTARWDEPALCRRRDPALYWIAATASSHMKTQRVAQENCYGCPVLAECARRAREDGSHGVIRGGVAIYSRSSQYLELLEFVAEHGELPDQDAFDDPALERCLDCGQRLRPHRAPASTQPGTTRRGRGGRCDSCTRLHKEVVRWAA